MSIDELIDKTIEALQTIEELLVEMKNCRTNLKYKDKMESIVSVLNAAITEIEELKSDIE